MTLKGKAINPHHINIYCYWPIVEHLHCGICKANKQCNAITIELINNSTIPKHKLDICFPQSAGAWEVPHVQGSLISRQQSNPFEEIRKHGSLPNKGSFWSRSWGILGKGNNYDFQWVLGHVTHVDVRTDITVDIFLPIQEVMRMFED